MGVQRASAVSLLLIFAACGGGSSEPPEAAAVRPKVEASTGWTFTSVPAYARVDRAGLLAHLERKLEGEPGRRVAALGRAFKTLGVLPKDYSLLDGLKEAYTEEILALYDVEEKKIFLVNEALEKEPKTPEEKMLRDITLAHEMVHALQHQHNPALELVESEDPDLDDVKVALHAFVEGEATIQGYALFGTRAEQYGQLGPSLEQNARTKFTSEPALIRRALYFPYAAGTTHIARKAAEGVEGQAPRLHGSIPLSTEHLLHDRTAEKDPPVAVFLPDLSSVVGGGRTRTYEGVLGEAYLTPILGRNPASIAGGFETLRWGGDRLHLYEKEGEADPVVVLLTLWDDFESTETLLKRVAGSPMHASRRGRAVVLVAGLPTDEAVTVADAAIGKGVMRPFRSREELEKLKGELSD